MAKPKNSTALYEVIRKSEADVRQAGTRGCEPEVRAAAPKPPPAEPEEVAEPPGGDGEAPAPLFEVAGGQVRLALTPGALAVAIFAIACLLVIAYGLGVRVGQDRGRQEGFTEGQQAAESDSWDDIRAARAKPPAEGLFEDVGVSPVGQPQAEPAASDPGTGGPELQWVRGYTYVVVQDFRADAAADAQRAQEYLLDNGVETAVIELSGDWKYRLITTQGFNRDDPVQRQLAEDYLARVRELGQAFFEAGGRYRLEGYFKKRTADTW